MTIALPYKENNRTFQQVDFGEQYLGYFTSAVPHEYQTFLGKTRVYSEPPEVELGKWCNLEFSHTGQGEYYFKMWEADNSEPTEPQLYLPGLTMEESEFEADDEFPIRFLASFGDETQETNC